MPLNYSHILSALPVFEAAARHGNFSQAAEELGLTQSAVSRRVQSLERHLGVVLFTRQGRSLRITANGQKLAETALDALRLVETANLALGNPASGFLRIGTLPSLGSLWLAPRIDSFIEKFPDVSLSITTFDADFSGARKDPVTWDTSSLDVVLTWGRGGWKSLVHKPFSREEMIAVCSPGLLARYPVTTPADLWKAPRLLHKTRPDSWQSCAMHFRLKDLPNDDAVKLEFEHFFMIIEAARCGLGVALLPSILVEADLRSGKLVSCSKPWRTGNFYAVVANESAIARPVVSAFVEWVTAQQ